jgi:hypothetical protein
MVLDIHKQKYKSRYHLTPITKWIINLIAKCKTIKPLEDNIEEKPVTLGLELRFLDTTSKA